MSKSANKYLTIALCIFVAALCNIFAHMITEYRLANKLLNSYRTFFYIGLFSFWGLSVRKRIIKPQVRSLLTIAAAMMVFWQILRVFKYRFVIDINTIRIMWYLYYVPFLLIPSIAVLVSVSLDKPYDYKLPAVAGLILIPPMILIVLVITNDLHQLTFHFPDNTVWSEDNHRHTLCSFIYNKCSLCAKGFRRHGNILLPFLCRIF